MPANTPTRMETLVSLCKRRGFVYPASEIYGGINGFWDYGPLGVLLKNNVRDWWWKQTVECPPDGPDGRPVSVVGLDSAIIQNPKAWIASGHVGGFSDPMRKCRRCGHFVRGDHLWDIIVTGSKWFDSLMQEFSPHEGRIESPKLLSWARGKGKRLAPNLAVVRNPEVTLSWLATRVQGQPDVPPDPQEIVRYLATEQLHADGLQDPCPLCGGEMGEPQQVSLMFETHAGLTKAEENKVYLRPETAQGIFLNYKNVLDTSRVKVPFGIAQVGKSFRNEVTPRNFIFRSREFEQMELEWFCHPDEAGTWFDFWKHTRMNWWKSLGVNPANLRFRDHDKDELSHYAKAGVGTVDVEYKYPFTDPDFGELEGIAHRTDFDLLAHQQHSGQKMEYFDEATKARFVPHVIEPASGLTRAVLVVLCEAFHEEQVEGETRTVLKFAPHLAPTKVAVFPLVKKDGLPDIADKIYRDLRRHYSCFYDEAGAVGRRYRRQDEIGTPFCVTVDGDTKTDQTVTVRHRDAMTQERVGVDNLRAYLADNLAPPAV